MLQVFQLSFHMFKMLVMRGMKDILLITLYMFMTIVRAMQPGGVRKLVAENIVLRQQLITMRRRQKISLEIRFNGSIDFWLFSFDDKSQPINKSEHHYQASHDTKVS